MLTGAGKFKVGWRKVNSDPPKRRVGAVYRSRFGKDPSPCHTVVPCEGGIATPIVAVRRSWRGAIRQATHWSSPNIAAMIGTVDVGRLNATCMEGNLRCATCCQGHCHEIGSASRFG